MITHPRVYIGEEVLPHKVFEITGTNSPVYVAIVGVEGVHCLPLYWGAEHVLTLDTCVWHGDFYISAHLGKIFPAGYVGIHSVRGADHSNPVLQYTNGDFRAVAMKEHLASSWRLLVHHNTSIATLRQVALHKRLPGESNG